MLSIEHRAIVKSTVPLLEAGGEALTTHFYELLLTTHPEVQPFFNQANQQSGHQQRALANGVLMYARHIDELEKLGDLVAVIVNKHVSLQILPEHYPLVGACFLRSIREVLGAEVATDAVIEAWAAAYGQLADILIGAEKAVYDELASLPGGWRGGRAFTVIRKQAESNEISSFYLAPSDGGAVVVHRPGQYIGLRIVVNGQDVRRNYSLSAASDGLHYRISVKREPGGLVSNHLHDQVRIGDELELFPPSGHFTLKESAKPLVLISGGVGITPTLAMLQVALDTERPIRFIHAARDAGAHAFRDWIDALAEQHPQLERFYCYARHDDAADSAAPHGVGYIGLDQLASWMPEERDVDAYFLGPAPFMRAMKKNLALLGVPEKQTHFEFFGPATSLE
ncbi:MAG: nitric oxide dioxygenase [Rhizobacter sp.]|nr:nitric oxide dioxygenase [Rhizobacter sp.]